MKISEILSVENIKIALEQRGKNAIITELVDLMAKSPSVVNKEEVLNATLEREKAASTGIGNGIAIPHGKSMGVRELALSLGLIPEGTDFDSQDGEPCTIFWCLAAPLGPSGPHIKALSRVSRLMNKPELRDELIGCRSPEECYALLVKEEKSVFEI